MNKISQYLNEHLLGEITSEESTKKLFSSDDSILSITPDSIAYPKITNDIRKITRFCWQLAEKGHNLSVTVRGAGSDTSGAAIGKGIIINTISHLDNIIFVSFKNKDQFIHTQPGVNIGTVRQTLKSHNACIPMLSDKNYQTIGGFLANNEYTAESTKYGQVYDWVDRLEVVLSNGDLIETSRISKHELNKKKGLQTFEGEIYRKIDAIIDDHEDALKNKIETNDRLGYSGIAKVRQHDGSFDLTPLIIGSQGTLGIISEIVMKIDVDSSESYSILAMFEDKNQASDVADKISDFEPTILEYTDGNIIKQAMQSGKKYIFSSDFSNKEIGASLFIKFDDNNIHRQKKSIKKTLKILEKSQSTIFTTDDYQANELDAIRNINVINAHNQPKNKTYLPIIDGSSIPKNRREEFMISLDELAKKHALDLAVKIDWLSGIIFTKPLLDLHTVSDKQKTFKLISDYMELVNKSGGIMLVKNGEGRLKSVACYPNEDGELLGIYKQIREAFDPFNILNPGVKQESDLKTLISELDPNYESPILSAYSQID